MGDVILNFDDFRFLEIKNCYYIPVFNRNLISVSCLMRQGYSVLFDNKVSIRKNKSLIYTGTHRNNLFFIQPKSISLHNLESDSEHVEPKHKKVKVSTNDETYLWHLRLGHINLNRIQRLVSDEPVSSLEIKPLLTCESCLEGKMTKRPFTGKGLRV